MTKNQDVRVKLVLFELSQRFWFWNPLICFGLGDHQSNPHLWSTDGVQNLSSWHQNLRFIHLIGISLGLFSRLHQGFSFKVQMNSHKCVGTWNYIGSLIQPTILVRCLPVSNLPFSFGAYHSHLPFPPTVPTYRSHQKFSSTILNYLSTILHLSTINRRARFTKNSS